MNNETNVRRYEHEILQPHRVHELILEAKEITHAGRRLLVGTSYGGRKVPDENVAGASDFLLLHGNGVTDPARIGEMVAQTRALEAYRARPLPVVFNEDDHFAFDQPRNNLTTAVESYASWGYFDGGASSGGGVALGNYADGYQLVPVNWGINTPVKEGFFRLLGEITGAPGGGQEGAGAAPGGAPEGAPSDDPQALQREAEEQVRRNSQTLRAHPLPPDGRAVVRTSAREPHGPTDRRRAARRPRGAPGADELAFATVSELQGLLVTGRVSSEELTRLALERLQRLGPRYNAVATVTAGRALAEARARDRARRRGAARGDLHGIPYGAKDLLAARGAPTTWGAPALPRPGLRRGRHGGAAPGAGRGGAGGEAGHGGAGRRRGLPLPLRLPAGAGEDALEPRALGRRLLQRIGRGGRRRAGAVRHRVGDVRVYHHPGRLLRGHRPAPHLRPRLPPRGDAPLLDAGQAGAAWPARRTAALACCRPSPGATGTTPAPPGAPSVTSPCLLAALRRLRLGFAPADFDHLAAPEARPAFSAALDVLWELGAPRAEVGLPPGLPYGPLVGTIIGAEEGAVFGPLIESEAFQTLVDAKQKAGLRAGPGHHGAGLPGRDAPAGGGAAGLRRPLPGRGRPGRGGRARARPRSWTSPSTGALLPGPRRSRTTARPIRP